MRLIFLCLVLFIFGSCQKPTDPTDPGNRDTTATRCDWPRSGFVYEWSWEFDTVGWWPSEGGSVGMYAFSDSDAYVMGYLGGGPPDYPVLMGMHWNGKEWTRTLDGLPNTTPNMYGKAITGAKNEMITVGYYSLTNEKMAISEFNHLTKKWKTFRYQTPGWLVTVWTDKKGFYIAGGTGGVLFRKDGPNSPWVQFKTPDNLTVSKIDGVSKDEWFLNCYGYGESNEDLNRVYRYYHGSFEVLYDQTDTAGNPIKEPDNETAGFTDLAVYQCPATDSLFMILTGWNSVRVETDRTRNHYTTTSLRSLGLSLKREVSTALCVDLYNPNDYYIYGSRFNMYRWTGTGFKMVTFYVPEIPSFEEVGAGYFFKRIVRPSRMIFWLFQVRPQVYVVGRGYPN